MIRNVNKLESWNDGIMGLSILFFWAHHSNIPFFHYFFFTTCGLCERHLFLFFHGLFLWGKPRFCPHSESLVQFGLGFLEADPASCTARYPLGKHPGLGKGYFKDQQTNTMYHPPQFLST